MKKFLRPAQLRTRVNAKEIPPDNLNPCCVRTRIVENQTSTMQVATPKFPQKRNGAINTVQKEDLPIHGWYRFVLSYPPHLVRQYLDAFGLDSDGLLFDPFCGTGTTLAEAKKNRIPSVGCDAHPFVALVLPVKTNWTVDTKALRSVFRRILKRTEELSAKHGLQLFNFDVS